MKNYYDELEVSKTASKEVIEKVYKVLAKKYHPDTTKEIDKQAAEEKFKIISEAYEILSDDEKRKKYDLEFEESNPTISYEEYINVVNQRDSLNNAFNNLKNEFYQFKDSFNIGTQSQYNMHQYDNTNINNGYNNYENENINQNYTKPNTNPNKKTYYYTATGKPASAFDYFKYRMKELFSTIFFFILVILAILLFISNISSVNLFDLFF